MSGTDDSDCRRGTNALTRQISALLAKKFHLEVPSPETDLIDTGYLDSLMLVEFLAQLEEEFGIQVSYDDLELDRIRTISRIADVVAAKDGRGEVSSTRDRNSDD